MKNMKDSKKKLAGLSAYHCLDLRCSTVAFNVPCLSASVLQNICCFTDTGPRICAPPSEHNGLLEVSVLNQNDGAICTQECIFCCCGVKLRIETMSHTQSSEMEIQQAPTPEIFWLSLRSSCHKKAFNGTCRMGYANFS